MGIGPRSVADAGAAGETHLEERGLRDVEVKVGTHVHTVVAIAVLIVTAVIELLIKVSLIDKVNTGEVTHKIGK